MVMIEVRCVCRPSMQINQLWLRTAEPVHHGCDWGISGGGGGACVCVCVWGVLKVLKTIMFPLPSVLKLVVVTSPRPPTAWSYWVLQEGDA